jgi:hypothetical protein
MRVPMACDMSRTVSGEQPLDARGVRYTSNGKCRSTGVCRPLLSSMIGLSIRHHCVLPSFAPFSLRDFRCTLGTLWRFSPAQARLSRGKRQWLVVCRREVRTAECALGSG